MLSVKRFTMYIECQKIFKLIQLNTDKSQTNAIDTNKKMHTITRFASRELSHIQCIDGFRNTTKRTLDSAVDHTVAVAHERRERINTRRTRLMTNRTIRTKTLLRTKLRNLAQIVWRGLIHPIQPITP